MVANTDESLDNFQRALIEQLRDFADSGMTDLPSADPAQVSQWIESVSALECQPGPKGEVAQEAAVTQSAAATQSASITETPSHVSSTQSPVAPMTPQLGLPGIGGDAQAYPPSQDAPTRKATLDVICNEVSGCQNCPELAAQRRNTVFGVGDPSARLCFLGEAPGADEDRMGEPFVGKAGQLLTRIIEACKLSRDDVYILNTIKCRPPGNRNPDEDEIGNCWQFAHRQLEVIQPEVIVCLGSVAAKTLLNTKQSVGRLRQQFHRYRNSQVLVTYHPAYLLRNPSAKRSVWDDMKMAMAQLGVQL